MLHKLNLHHLSKHFSTDRTSEKTSTNTAALLSVIHMNKKNVLFHQKYYKSVQNGLIPLQRLGFGFWIFSSQILSSTQSRVCNLSMHQTLDIYYEHCLVLGTSLFGNQSFLPITGQVERFKVCRFTYILWSPKGNIIYTWRSVKGPFESSSLGCGLRRWVTADLRSYLKQDKIPDRED